MSRYAHQELNSEIYSIAGYYSPLKEIVVKYEGREVLCVIGQANIESGCCGNRCWEYALVPGYIVKWQSEKDKHGLAVSEVEPIYDDKTRAKISQIIKEAEMVSQIEFW